MASLRYGVSVVKRQHEKNLPPDGVSVAACLLLGCHFSLAKLIACWLVAQREQSSHFLVSPPDLCTSSCR